MAGRIEDAHRLLDTVTGSLRTAEWYFLMGNVLQRKGWLADARTYFEEAVRRKVAYVPGTHFYAHGGHDNTLRLNFTMADEAQIEKGMQLLGELFTDGGNK